MPTGETIVITTCKECENVFLDGKWEPPSENTKARVEMIIANAENSYTFNHETCPECQK
ncbi:MAG: hypothetical protein PHZ04_04995 [Patescibacteria group bacterium]|nr:hypothetical protein [Patescibacteria group bacterium]MDD5294431.1 hypothetical protein [Patescibacteria group bacterium]MDD5554105.1 hypothetical protein [Patescibacteria group bacterium]